MESGHADRTGRGVIYDCFTFFNELDLLDIRLHELASTVDVFVLAEAPLTFQGERKSLVFQQHRDRYRPYLDQIRHVVVEDMPTGEQPSQWTREYFQRNALKRGLTDARDSDLVIISDADEILRADAIQEAARRAEFCFFELDFFNYYMDWKVTEWPVGPWIEPYAAPWSIIRDMADFSRPRANPYAYMTEIGTTPDSGVIKRGGWHFSWLGGPERMVEKLEAFSHTEPDVVAWRDVGRLAEEVRQRRFFYNGVTLTQVPVDAAFPALIRERETEYRRHGLLSPTES
jgi:hypothetical protein